MIAQTAVTFHPQGTAPMMGRDMGRDMALRGTCAVQLFDRRTGRAHRINGTPLVIYTRNPAAAVEDLLDGRDPGVWDARIHEIEPGRAS